MHKLVVIVVAFLMCFLGKPSEILHGQSILNPQVQVVLKPAANINTKHLEYAPMYYGQGIVFVHARAQEQQVIDVRLGMPFYELMYAELSPDGMPGKSNNFSANIRTRFHEGPCTFTNDLQQIFFTRQNMLNGQHVLDAEKRTNLKIYIADKGPEDWMDPRELPFCSDDYSVQCPTLSPDNQQLIFMSDMPGGFGGWDLYISERYSGSWSVPVNLGATINTPKYERLPFWHESGVLFFASDGHDGMGGLDLFASLRQEDGSFSVPVNLGSKFNSRQDDLSFICDKDGKTGFFASARRSGLGKDDIYAFVSDQSIFDPALMESSLVRMTLTVRDKDSFDPISEAGVWIFPIGPMGPEGLDESFDKEIVTNVDGSESVVLKAKSSIPPYVSDIKGAIPIELNPNQDYLIILNADEYMQREVTMPRASVRKGQEYLLDLQLSEPTTTNPVPDRDCITTGALVLSTSSQKPVDRVLVQARSTCTGTVQVMETDEKGRFRTCLVPGCDYQFRFLKTGFLEQSYRYTPGTDPADRTIYMSEEDLEERTGGPPEPGDVLVLEHIYYDFNKSAIRTGDARELESLAKMMLKYPSMTIELQSHTDSRGSTEYNMELSAKRGESVKEFLTSREISAERVQLKPMGESMLRNACEDGITCSDEEHQKNRRTEIRILTVVPQLEVKYSGQK